MGLSEFILLCKHHNQDDWKNEPNLATFGQISEFELFRKWPVSKVNESSSSPPKGRPRTTTKHNLSASSNDSTPVVKKQKLFADVFQTQP